MTDDCETQTTIDTCGDDPCCGDPCCGDPDCCGDSTAGCNEDADDDATDDSDDDGPLPDPCSDLDCEPGSCVLDGTEQPSCECPDDYVSVGDACVECIAVAGAHDVDLPTVELQIGATLDGGVAPGGASRWWLVGVGGDEVELGDVFAGVRTLDVLPGRYSVFYGWISGDALPRNSAIRVGSLDAQNEVIDVAIDVPTSRITGAFTFDGLPPPDSSAENGEVFLRSGEDEVSLGETRAGTFEVLVVPGSYDVEYRVIASDAIAPRNSAGTIANITAVPGRGTIDLDIQTVALSGAFSIDGAVPPTTEDASGRISLVSANGRDTVVLGETHEGSYETRMLAGSYEVIYEVTAAGAGVPGNARALLGEASVDIGASVLDIDVASAELAGVLTLSGVPGDAATTGDAALFLSNERGDLVQLGNLATGAYTAAVVPGSYDVVYAHLEPGGAELPINGAAVVATVDIITGDDMMLDVDIPAIELSGSITIDGAMPPVMGDGGRILLDDERSGAPFVIADAGDATFSTTVVPGDYTVRYAADPPTIVAPSNADVVIASVSLAESTVVDLDVPVTDVSGTITVDGAAPGAAEAELRHTDAESPGALALVSAVADGAYSGRLVPTRYVVRYAAVDPEASPANRDAAVACVDVSE